MPERMKIGQIGIGHNHGSAKMKAVRKFPALFEVIGFSEDDPAWLEKRGNLNCYRDLPRLPEKELIEKADAILIETDVPYLTETAQRCMDAGKHLHLDKPASGNLADFKKLLTDAESKKRVVQMGYMYRYNPAVMQCMELAKSGALGEIYSVNAEMSTYHAPAYKKWLTGFRGGIMYILGSHLVDLVVSLLGTPDKVYPFLKHTGLDGIDFPDNNQAILEYKKALARINVSSVEMNGWGRRQLIVAGSKGTVAIEPIENTTHITYAHSGISTNPYEDMKETLECQDVPKDSRYDRMMQDFYTYITGQESNPYTYAHEYQVQKLLYQICGNEEGTV